MSDFDGYKDFTAKADRLPVLTAGEYVLEVIENAVIPVKQGKGKAILRSFKIVKSSGVSALPEGTEAKAKLLYFTDQWFDNRLGEYTAALTGHKTVDKDTLSKIFSPANPAATKKIRVSVAEFPNADGKPYLRNDWSYIKE